ncbi:MAG: hypothetical protein AB1806_19450 [Acidobacteriota bacterium]
MRRSCLAHLNGRSVPIVHTSLTSYCPPVAGRFRSAVSLHSHTSHSREVLTFLPGLVGKLPVASVLLREKMNRFERETGMPLDFSRGYWRPPLGRRAVFESEAQQAMTRFGLPWFVSITDHDSIDAGLALAALGVRDRAPVSVEWTVPYQDTVFHLGLHNLPPDEAQAMREACEELTTVPSPPRLAELLAWVTEETSTLAVLNHPLWNAHGNLEQGHHALASLVRELRPLLHATEVNGCRNWTKNRAVVQLARAWDMPVVVGDRHGCSPNAFLNLSAAQSFAEFVTEVRRDRRSDVVIMPEYHEHATTRILEAAADILRDDSNLEPGQQRWVDRVLVVLEDGSTRPLSAFWTHGGPWWVRACVGAMRLLGGPAARPARRLAFSPQEVTL